MRKTLKTTLAVLLAVLLLASLSATVLADTAPARDPARLTSVTVHHLVLPDGSITPGSPTGTPAPNPAGIPVEGAVWELFSVTAPGDWNGTYTELRDAINAGTAGWALTSVSTQTTGANGQAAWTGRTQGVYLLVNNSIPAPVIALGATTSDPILVSLPLYIPGLWNPPTATPADGNWVYNVHVFPKAETEPVIGKTAGTPEWVGNVVHLPWTINFEIPMGLGNIPQVPVPPAAAAGTYILVTDELDDRLTLVPASVAVTFFNGTTQVALPQAGNWVLAENTAGANNYFTISFTQAGRDAIAAFNTTTPSNVGGMVLINFTTTAVLEAGDALGDIPNNFSLNVGNNDRVTITDPEDIPTQRLFGLRVTKRSSYDDALLPNATFHVYRAVDVVGGNALRTTGVPLPVVPVAVITTNALGVASFDGLIAGSYYLREVSPPVGYQVIQDFIRFTVNEDMSSPYLHSVTVYNRRDFRLPLTGGMGAVIFTAAGAAMIGFALLMMFAAKKKKKADA